MVVLIVLGSKQQSDLSATRKLVQFAQCIRSFLACKFGHVLFAERRPAVETGMISLAQLVGRSQIAGPLVDRSGRLGQSPRP